MAIRIRHTNRYREIVVALVRHGFGYMAEELGLFHLLSLPRKWIRKQPTAYSKTVGERIRLVLEDLGPTFIKLGQLFSTRQDVLSANIIAELGKLQDQVPPFSYEQVKEIIAQELGQPLEHVFSEFAEAPLAAASIGQVHLARLMSGEAVAVKVRRPLVEKTIRQDLEILAALTELAEKRVEWVSRYQIRELVEEFSRSLQAELDYVQEGKNADKIALKVKHDPWVHIPKVFWAYTTPKVLTMEYLEGMKLNQNDRIQAAGIRLKDVSERLVRTMLQQILIDGFFHADPHPGNVFVLKDGAIAFVDFGMVGRLTEEMQIHLSSLIIAAIRKNNDAMIRAILRLGIVSDEVDSLALQKDLDLLREQYYDLPLSQISLGKALNELFAVANRHRIRLPGDLALLAKTLLTVEGVTGALNPELSLIDIAEPFGRRLIKERLSPTRIRKRFWKKIPDAIEALTDIPRQANQLSRLIRTGKLRMEISLAEIEVLMRKLDQISNRISFSIVLLSFSIVLVGLMIASGLGSKPFLGHFPFVELGSCTAGLMLLWLLYSIFKSGRF